MALSVRTSNVFICFMCSLRRSGDCRLLSMLTTPIRQGRTVVGLLAVARDVSDERELLLFAPGTEPGRSRTARAVARLLLQLASGRDGARRGMLVAEINGGSPTAEHFTPTGPATVKTICFAGADMVLALAIAAPRGAKLGVPVDRSAVRTPVAAQMAAALAC